MLLDAGRPDEAEVVYSADLRNNSGNGYSLLGLQPALEQHGKLTEAKEVAERFGRAWSGATHPLTSSSF